MNDRYERLPLRRALAVLKLLNRVINSRQTIYQLRGWKLRAEIVDSRETENLLKLFELGQEVLIENFRDSQTNELHPLRSYID